MAKLAIEGGSPVRKKMLPYGRQCLSEQDIARVVDVLRSDWLTTGPKVAEFENAFASSVGAKHAVSFSSGTAALHGAVFAAGLQTGDEVITSPMTFCATANCVLYQGGTPVFADICPDTLNIDPARAAERISARTKVILPVDYAGHPADLEPIVDLAQKHGLVVVEDACHALGAEYRGAKVGSISHMTAFSFHPVKHITTGEGGMVTTNDPDLAARLRMFRNHGLDSDGYQRANEGQWHYQMKFLGYNYRLTDISCALGLSQLSRLEENVQRRRAIAQRYETGLQGIPGVNTPVVREEANSAWHLYVIRPGLDLLRGDRDKVVAALRAEGIGANVHYLPVHLHRYYRDRFGYKEGDYPVSEEIYKEIVSLPMFHGMTDQDVDDVIEAVHRVLTHYALP